MIVRTIKMWTITIMLLIPTSAFAVEFNLNKPCNQQMIDLLATEEPAAVSKALMVSFNHVDPSFNVRLDNVQRWNERTAFALIEMTSSIFKNACDQKKVTPQQAVTIAIKSVNPYLNAAIEASKGQRI